MQKSISSAANASQVRQQIEYIYYFFYYYNIL